MKSETNLEQNSAILVDTERMTCFGLVSFVLKCIKCLEPNIGLLTERQPVPLGCPDHIRALWQLPVQPLTNQSVTENQQRMTEHPQKNTKRSQPKKKSLKPSKQNQKKLCKALRSPTWQPTWTCAAGPPQLTI